MTKTTTSPATTIPLPPARQFSPPMQRPSIDMPPITHDVIALISGGKDSFLAILHCLAQNHHVVALANLHPPVQSPPSSPALSPPANAATNATADTAPDPNSYMYQTVGHTLIPLYARALSIPLYRGEILGTVVNSQRDYHPSGSTSPPPSDSTPPQREPAEPADETESLIPLLRRIQRAHPSATALVSGAILSSYQRSRIESVALRLGLVPLAPLWQYPFLPTPVPRAAGLLEDVAAVGLEARMVKVASGGLDEGFLWGDLRDAAMRRRVESGVGRFGGSVLGEGGEFESLVVDGPEDLFQGRIDLAEAERVVRRGEGGEAYLEFAGGRVLKKEEKKPLARDNISGEEWRRRLRVPGLWDERFKALVRRIKEPVLPRTCSSAFDNDDPDIEYHPIPTEQPPRPSPLLSKRIIIPQAQTTYTRSTLTLSNLTFVSSSPSSPSPPSPSTLTPLPFPPPSSSSVIAIRQTHSIISHLRTLLATFQPPRSPSDILFTTLLLRHMSHFPIVNAAYAEFFAEGEGGGKPIPPARVTVGCGDRLPPEVEVMMRVVVARGTEEDDETGATRGGTGATRGEGNKDGLHVQSRSYWAPANIGPYSQAVVCAMPPLLLPRKLEAEEEEGQGFGQPVAMYVAGQIPLVPASMQVFTGREEGEEHRVHKGEWHAPEKENEKKEEEEDEEEDEAEEEEDDEEKRKAQFGPQTCLALQHLWRVGATMRVQWWMGAVAFLASPPPPSPRKRDDSEREREREMEMEMDRRARTAWSAWNMIHDPTVSNTDAQDEAAGEADEPGFDVWDRKYGLAANWGVGKDEEQQHQLPDFAVVRGDAGSGSAEGADGSGRTDKTTTTTPGFFAVQVHQLPRGCPVEWHSPLGVRALARFHLASSSPARGGGYPRTTCTAPGLGSITFVSIPLLHTRAGVEAQLAAIAHHVRAAAGTLKRMAGGVEMTVYASPRWVGADVEHGQADEEEEIHTAIAKAQLIPCAAVWGPAGTRLAAGVVLSIGF